MKFILIKYYRHSLKKMQTLFHKSFFMNLIPFRAVLDDTFVNTEFKDNSNFRIDGIYVLLDDVKIGELSTLYNEHIMVKDTLSNLFKYNIVFHGYLPYTSRVISMSIV